MCATKFADCGVSAFSEESEEGAVQTEDYRPLSVCLPSLFMQVIPVSSRLHGLDCYL